ncbi:MAG: exodeoxyribonuclease I [Luminiphilus sp.]|nr:exodeoxyribonuclease I [Luminiphilus sp.]
MSSSDTFYWHDYETSGADAVQDRPWQFAGVRTDTALEIIGEPLTIYARPTPDRLPHPAAIRVTGITPQEAEAKGVVESEFIAMILAELARPKTCGVGYNSIRFDDEITRFASWRNFRDAYAREWQNDNSRWDLLDVTRAFRALRPDGVDWPQRAGGLTSFKLEDLTAANGIEHGAAHDAMADVVATIEMAKLLKRADETLFATLYRQRSKRALGALLDLELLTPLVHVSGMFGAARHNLAIIVPVAWHPHNNGEIICVDLGRPPHFLDLDPDVLRDRMFTPSRELEEGAERLPIKTIRLNRAPVLLPVQWVAGQVAERLGFDGDLYRGHLAALREARADNPAAFTERFQAIWRQQDFPARSDPDVMLYSGFLSNSDRALCDQVVATVPESLASHSYPFEDGRLPELLFRYRARNYPQTLTAAEAAQWREHCAIQWREGAFTLAQFESELAEERARPGLTQTLSDALDELEGWVRSLSVET